MVKKLFPFLLWGLFSFWLYIILPNQAIAQDWRLSADYSIKSVGIDYVPNRTYIGELGAISKGMVELELERYLFYRFYVAGKAEFLLHNQKDPFIGGSVDYDQFNLGLITGIQFPKFGFYGGIKFGHINDVRIQATNFKNGNRSWVYPKQPVNQLTTGFTAGIKYYLLNFVRLKAEINQMYFLPDNIVPQSSFTENPAFRSFEFSPVSVSVGISVGFPWSRPKKNPSSNKNKPLPELITDAPVNFSNPLKETFVTSGFGPRWNSVHEGVDLNAGFRDEILAAEDGIVVKAGRGSGYGKMVRIKHSGGYETLYAHMSRISVKEGDRISKGDVLGKAGNTGTSTGVHLHFEILKDGKPVNPLSYLRFE